MKTIKLIVALATTIHLTSVNSQDLNLTYADGTSTSTVALPLDNSQSMSIDQNTGSINISTTYNADDIVTNLGLECTGLPPVVTINNTSGGSTTSATVSYTLPNNDAVYCQKFNQWSGTFLGNPLVASGSQLVNSNGTYTMSCTNSFGTSNLVSTVVTTIQEPVSPPTIQLSATPNLIDAGNSSTLAWSITNTPTSCTKSGDWPDNGSMPSQDITNGNNHSQVISNITSNSTYTISCSNSAGTTSQSSSTATVTINGSWTAVGANPDPWNGGSACTGARAPILSSNEDRQILAQGSTTPPLTYNGTFNQFQGVPPNNAPSNWVGTPFPGIDAENVYLNLKRGKYIAAIFNSGNQNRNAKFAFETPPSFSGPIPSALTITISKCPGDFSDEPLVGQTRCKAVGTAASLYWSDISAQNGFYCKLEKNTDYFLNIVHANNPPLYNNSGCATSSCGILTTLQPQF